MDADWLEGAELDAAVAKCLGYTLDGDGYRLDERMPGGAPMPFHPSTNWADGGPIIEREGIIFGLTGLSAPGQWVARPGCTINDYSDTIEGVGAYFTGSSPLVAAMRAYVASKR